jgi:cytidylate kinase
MQSHADFFDRKSFAKNSFSPEELAPVPHLTITAPSGAGKTTTILLFRSTLPQYTFVSGGTIMRQMAAEKGFKTIEEFAAHNREHPEEGNDLACDHELRRAALSTQYLIIDSRLGQVADPGACHALIKCSLAVRAERQFWDRRKKEPGLALGKVMTELDQRDRDDNERYEKLYPGALWPELHYDIVVSSETKRPKEVYQFIYDRYHAWLDRHFGQKIIVPGHRIVSTHTLGSSMSVGV